MYAHHQILLSLKINLNKQLLEAFEQKLVCLDFVKYYEIFSVLSVYFDHVDYKFKQKMVNWYLYIILDRPCSLYFRKHTKKQKAIWKKKPTEKLLKMGILSNAIFCAFLINILIV